MNKILTVGHPQSGCHEVERVLHACGMQPAMPSKKEGFTPFDISSTLCRAHGIPLVHEIDSEEQVKQIDAGPVWNGLALDLLLGNLEQRLWGWSDPQALCLLEYWKNLDPKMTFVLVYDEPHRVLAETFCDEGMCLSEAAVLQRLDNWNAYNGALLRFYLRNKARCMLVNAQQVRNNSESCLKELQSHLDVPLSLPEHYSGNGFSRIDDKHNGVDSDAATHISVTHSIEITTPTVVERYLIDRILETHPAHLQRYEEMQSVARVPLDANARSYPEPLDAWLAQMKMRSESGHILALIAEEKRLAEQQLNLKENELQLLREQIVQLEEGLIESQDIRKNGKLEELTEENELLLLQLHQVQDELERYYLENQKLYQKNNNPDYYGAADRIKQQLSYRLGSVMIGHSKSVSGWFTMPGALLKERKAFHREKAESAPKKLPPVYKYRDAHEAEKVKKHLSYRLGSLMVQYGSSPAGWLKLPFFLRREVRAFKKERNSK